MELLVIVLSLLSERFLVHKLSHKRFHWFMTYSNAISTRLKRIWPRISPWVVLGFIVIPVLLLVANILYLIDNVLFGLGALVCNIAIFYYCIGPINPFYPVLSSADERPIDEHIRDYLVHVNEQLFAILFWYIVLGPLSILAYRFISQSKHQSIVSHQATKVLDILDWFPARMTALLYLLVGNFQVGFKIFCSLFFTAPHKNKKILSRCAMAALSINNSDQKTMLQAEDLVEHATVVLLVLLAIYTMVSWI